MEAVLRTIQHFIQTPCSVLPHINKDGTLAKNQDPPYRGRPWDAVGRVLLYTRFKRNFPMITSVCFTSQPALLFVGTNQQQKVLNVHGIQSASIHGSLTPAQRQKVVTEFSKPASTTQVLLCSDVGSTGLNIQAANIILLIVSDKTFCNCHQGTISTTIIVGPTLV